MSAICAHIGRIKEATIADERARLSNPKTKARNFGYNSLYGGDLVRAEEVAKAWLAQVPLWPHSFSFAAECALTNRDPGLADEQLTAGFRILPADDPMLLSLQSVLCACRGEKSAALECVHKSLKSPWPFQHIHHASHQVARTYAALGDLDKAVAWLQRAAETGFPCACYFRIDPDWQICAACRHSNSQRPGEKILRAENRAPVEQGFLATRASSRLVGSYR